MCIRDRSELPDESRPPWQQTLRVVLPHLRGKAAGRGEARDWRRVSLRSGRTASSDVRLGAVDPLPLTALSNARSVSSHPAGRPPVLPRAASAPFAGWNAHPATGGRCYIVSG